jgi:single-stranded DNA-binding protein
MNTVALVGHVARAPTVRFEGDGVQVTTFTLAVQEQSREGRLWTLYAPCTAWGHNAEQCSLLNAEDLVAISGKLSWRKQASRCGQEHSQLCVQVQTVAVLVAAVTL